MSRDLKSQKKKSHVKTKNPGTPYKISKHFKTFKQRLKIFKQHSHAHPEHLLIAEHVTVN